MSDNGTPTEVIDATLAEALRKQHKIDYLEAGTKAPVSGFEYKGVRIESRWSVYSELETMKSIIDAMPELMARRLSGIWCDSNCSANYVVGVRRGLFVPSLKIEISNAIMSTAVGHNGVVIEEGDKLCSGKYIDHLDPDWPEE